MDGAWIPLALDDRLRFQRIYLSIPIMGRIRSPYLVSTYDQDTDRCVYLEDGVYRIKQGYIYLGLERYVYAKFRVEGSDGGW